MNPHSDFLTGSALDDLQRFRLLVENAPFCIHELALDGTIRAMNPKGCEMLGLPGFSAVEGKHLSALVSESSLPIAEEAFKQAMQGETVDFECDLLSPSGGFLASSHLFPLCNSNGEVQSLFGVSIDISRGAGALEELRKSERRYRQMFETNLAVKFILNPKNGVIVEVNSAACEFYGYTADEMRGMSVFDLNVLTQEEIRLEMAEAAKEELLVFEFRHRLKNGEIRDVEVFSGPIDTEDGVRLYSIVHDVTKRKRAERELRNSEERLASAVRGSDDGVWDINLVTGETYWSDRCKALIGYQPDEVDANDHPQFSFLHPDDRERSRLAFERHLEKDGPYDLEVRILHAGGKHRWFRTRGEASWDEHGVPIRITGSIRDIHARYEVAERLRQSEERFAFAVAGSKEGLWDWDLPSGEMWWSPRLKELLGYGDSELAASREKLYSLMHPDDVVQTRQAAEDHLETGIEFDVQYRLHTKSKIYRWFRSRGQAVRNEKGVAVRASGVLTDIHDEVLAQEGVQRRAARIAKQQQSIFALASDPVLATKGLRSACKRITELACSVLDTGRCSVLLMEPGGRNLRSVDLYVAHKDEHFSGIVLEAGGLPNFFSQLEQSRAIVSNDPMKDARFDDFPRNYITDRKVKAIIEIPVRRAGKLVGLVGISDTQSHREWHEDEVNFGLDLGQQVARLLDQNDAHEAEEKQRDLERKMLHAQKMESLGLMAGGIAHDFNNLLVAILGNADLLRDSQLIGTKEKALVHEIESASHRAAELCQQMLAFSGHSKHEISRFDLQELVEEMIQLLNITVPKDATLYFSPSGTLPLIEGDPSQVRQVIMNLILNASESLPNGKGEIHLDIALLKNGCAPAKHGINVPRAGSYLCLKVRDDGCGMEEETLERMYDPFFSTKFKGRGLGLASVLGIVRAHYGGIQVESELGQGTTFRLCLPIAAEQDLPAGKKPISVENWKGSGLVLMVDDDETVLQLGKEMLSRLGFEVVQALDGAEALEKFRNHRRELRLVLLDLTMPGISGEDVYAAMQDLDASVPVVMSSGYTEQDVSLRLGERGLRGFLQKPYTLDQLRSKIHGLMSDQS
ncbi:MAG: PAS domain-containing protein [Planctomycetota bacterium]